MAHGRWYPTSTVLGDGRVMVFSGLTETGGTNTQVETYKAGVGWGTAVSAPWTPDLYPRLHLLPSGKVFYSGSNTQSRTFDPSNNTWSGVIATTIYGGTRTYGSSVLLPLTPANNYKPRVMIFGGGNPATKTTEIIDLSTGTPAWTSGPNMAQPRIEMNATLLPNGKILTVGGSLNDEDTGTASLQADLYDSNTNTMGSAGSNAFARLYHSVSLLLPDATVWVAGGNPSRGSYEQHVEIYTPPYLYNSNGTLATRPSISSINPSVIGYGTSFTVNMPDAANISSVVLMKSGAVTHAFDMDQRMVGLAFSGSGVLNVTGPPNGNIAPPGYYMLFVINAAGVPSVAKFIQVSKTPTDIAPTGAITSPSSDVFIAPGQSVTFAGTGTAPSGSITGYSWVFRGGSPSKSSVANPGAVTFSAAGTYTAVFTVTDNAGNTDQSPKTRTITVTVAPAPTLTVVNPNSGAQGQTLASVILTGSNFSSGATCNFGAGITVNSCAFNSSTQLTANLTIAANATVGTRNVSVTNPDGQSATLNNGFSVVAGIPNPPGLSAVNPNSGAQGQTLASVILTGSNFSSGATCNFGAGITVNSCAFNSSTQLTVNLTIAANATVGTRNVTVTNPDGQSATLTNGFSVTQAAGGTVHLNFNYANRSAFVADSWDFNAKTGGGALRNTEQTGSLAVSYDQTAHPGTLRVPILRGDIYSNSNNSQNTLLRDLPSDWTSLRLMISSFTPAANYQQVDIVAYQDDDNYVVLSRMEDNNPTMEFYQEQGGVPAADVGFKFLTNTQNLLLRLDRDVTTNTYSSYYSTDSGTTWVSMGSIVRTLTNARLAIHIGANYAGTQPTADLAWVEIVRPGTAMAPGLTAVNPNSGAQGQTLASVILTGSNFSSGATCNFGAGITVNSCAFNSSTQLTANLTIAANATVGTRNVSVTNPNGQSATLLNGFSVVAGIPNPPGLSAVNPNSGAQGQTLASVILTGSNFSSGATCNFGAGITVNSCTFNSSTQLTANVTIAANATVGTRNVTVTNPDGQSATLNNGFSVVAGIPNPPGLTAVNPNSGAQGQTLASVILTGSNFSSGATCNFGAGITVNSCAFNSSTQLTVNLTIAANATVGTRNVSVTNPDGQSATLTNGFSVTQAAGGTVHLNFNYANRSAFVADSWDFNAKTGGGALRNTEQTGSLAVSYDQTAHPGTLRVPILRGDIYSSSNNSQNTLLRDLPSDWTSIRLMISSFTPTANYQQVDLVAYQDDDNYVLLSRMEDNNPTMEFYQEQGGAPAADVGFKFLTNTQNLLLRLDRDVTTNTYSSYYSTDSGTSWVSMGSIVRTLTNARLAIHIGANYAGTQPTADLAWVEIVRP